MVDSKENYKFDLGFKGLTVYQCVTLFISRLPLGCKPFLRVYDGLKLIYTSGV